MRSWLPPLLLVLASLLAAPAGAQEVPSVELPEPRLLREGERAPFTGQLMAQEDVLRWARTIEDLQHRLVLDVRTEVERCDVRLELERARTGAAEDRLTLREGLLRERITELATAVQEARRAATREWYESPALWFAIGAIVATGVAVALAVAFAS